MLSSGGEYVDGNLSTQMGGEKWLLGLETENREQSLLSQLSQ